MLEESVQCSIPPNCARFLITYFEEVWGKQAKGCHRFERNMGGGYDSAAFFDCYSLSEGRDDKIITTIKDLLESSLYCEFDIIRLHRFSPTDHCTVHRDSAFPEHDTVMIRLDGYEGSRLYVNNKKVDEGLGKGIMIPAMTPHEVVTSVTGNYRYSLVGWCKQKD